jgi:hypothetical protein
MGSWQRDMAAHFGAYPAGPGTKEGGACTASTDAIATDAPAMVVDAYGGTDGLSRPGLRYLHAGHRSTDHAVAVAADAMRREAHADLIRERCDAWKTQLRHGRPNFAVTHNTSHATMC